MVVGFTTTYIFSANHHYRCEFESRWWWGVLDTTLCDTICQWLATGRWFFPGTPVSSTNKTDHHARYNWNIVESVVKHHKPNQILISFELDKTLYCMFWTEVQFDASYKSRTEYRLLGISCFILVLFVLPISFFSMFRNVFETKVEYVGMQRYYTSMIWPTCCIC
jgi:hypothetical protein